SLRADSIPDSGLNGVLGLYALEQQGSTNNRRKTCTNPIRAWDRWPTLSRNVDRVHPNLPFRRCTDKALQMQHFTGTSWSPQTPSNFNSMKTVWTKGVS